VSQLLKEDVGCLNNWLLEIVPEVAEGDIPSTKGFFGSVCNGVFLNQRAGRVHEYGPSSAFYISIS
jgi:hypothetical protein